MKYFLGALYVVPTLSGLSGLASTRERTDPAAQGRWVEMRLVRPRLLAAASAARDHAMPPRLRTPAPRTAPPETPTESKHVPRIIQDF